MGLGLERAEDLDWVLAAEDYPAVGWEKIVEIAVSWVLVLAVALSVFVLTATVNPPLRHWGW